MKLNQFLIVAAIVTGLFGVGFLFAPEQMAAFYGTSFNAGGTVAARVAGASLIALAVMVWSSRDQNSAEMFRGILLGGLVANALDLVTLAYAASNGVVGSGIGWATVVLNLLLGAGFAYFLFGKR